MKSEFFKRINSIVLIPISIFIILHGSLIFSLFIFNIFFLFMNGENVKR